MAIIRVSYIGKINRVIGTTHLDISAVPLDPHFDFLLNGPISKVRVTSTVAQHEIAKFIGAAIDPCDKVFNASSTICYRSST